MAREVRGPAGVVNFRDLGGYPACDGMRVAYGRVFRSSSLQDIDEAGCRFLLQDLRLRTIIDLRGLDEIEQAGIGPLQQRPVRYEVLPLVSEAVVLPGQAGDLVERYRKYLEPFGWAAVARALSLISDRSTHPVLIHCSAGKDRTGVVVALLLSCLGVARDDVIREYCVSAQNRLSVAQFLRRRPGYAELSDDDELLDARPEVIQRFLSLFERDGGLLPWMLASGLAEQTVQRLRTTLLMPGAGNSARISIRPSAYNGEPGA